MCGPKFCSMKITDDIRKMAADQKKSENEIIKEGLREKAEEFTSA